MYRKFRCLYCAAASGQRLLRGNQITAEADGADREPPYSVAHHAELFPSWVQDVYPLPRLQAEVIKSYFLNYPTMNSDFTIGLNTNDLKVHKIDHQQDWSVTLADTGALTMTGARVARAAAKYLGNAQYFA